MSLTVSMFVSAWEKNSAIIHQLSRLDLNEESNQVTKKGKGQQVLWGKDQKTSENYLLEGSSIHLKGQKRSRMKENGRIQNVSKIM